MQISKYVQSEWDTSHSNGVQFQALAKNNRIQRGKMGLDKATYEEKRWHTGTLLGVNSYAICIEKNKQVKKALN